MQIVLTLVGGPMDGSKAQFPSDIRSARVEAASGLYRRERLSPAIEIMRWSADGPQPNRWAPKKRVRDFRVARRPFGA